jgi:serine/threonine protein kinase
MGGAALDIQGTYTANVGSPGYMAPELLAYNQKTTRYSGQAVDMYSFGEALYELCV